ncbi:MAG: hypothetical protein JRJ75_09740 [Deltaproteobacteria bacterium]|nr:hypothetical protein [Deltaproteobacteria bacterium]MBW2024764.1 hypothetical protein [Deltaproteobacteria bacterium]
MDERMSESDRFISAYRAFRDSIDLDKEAGLPDINHLVWCLLAGVPAVPADEEDTPEAPLKAIDQRVAILKAVFVEVNSGEEDSFLDEALSIYDEAARVAKVLIEEALPPEKGI